MFTVDDLIFIQGHLGSYQIDLELMLDSGLCDKPEMVKKKIIHIREINNKISEYLKGE